jgi:uncharacterized DUF497 family protein
MDLRVEWDEAKARHVRLERGLVFADAATVFLDPFALTIVDDAHSTDEVRYVTIGATRKGRIVVVVHTDRGRRIRLITAWPATPAERRRYEEQARH